MDENSESIEWHRIESEEDPDRCQSLSHQGTEQCSYKAVPGSNYCPRHGGNMQMEKNKRQRIRNLKLTFARAGRVNELTQGPDVKTLYDEIAVLRFMLEELLNRFGDDRHELMLQAPIISQMVINITKTVEACQKLEERQGKYLDGVQIDALADSLLDILGEYIEDEQLEEMADKLNECFANATSIKDAPQVDNEM
jgi:hypothetical protein